MEMDMDKKDGWVDYIYLDLKRHLIRRLHIGGLKGTIKNWMKDYLKGREMNL